MQSVCTLLPAEYFQRVIDLRASLSEDPTLGAIYDPPFVHFTHQLAEDYDWDGLEQGLAEFAKRQSPFEICTIGLFVFTGNSATITVAPLRDRRLTDLQADIWEIASTFATGRVDAFYSPERWIPHVTIKRCGSDAAVFGSAMAKLAGENFTWTTTVDNVTVQHDPGKNSLTHYQRFRFALGGATHPVVAPDGSNATILAVTEDLDAKGPRWTATVRPDGGAEFEQRWTAPERVRLMAASGSSLVHFPDSRCLVKDGHVVSVFAHTPYPVAL